MRMIKADSKRDSTAQANERRKRQAEAAMSIGESRCRQISQGLESHEMWELQQVQVQQREGGSEVIRD